MNQKKVIRKKSGVGHIGKTQLAVIEDLMKGRYKYEVLAKHKVPPSRYNRWTQNEVFRKAIRQRIDAVHRQHRFLALQCLPDAIEKLAKIISTSQKDETARKACLDIVALHKEVMAENANNKAQEDAAQNKSLKISDAKAARMLEILAEPDEPESIVPVRQPPINNPEQGTQRITPQFPSPDPNTEYISYDQRIDRGLDSVASQSVLNQHQASSHEPTRIA